MTKIFFRIPRHLSHPFCRLNHMKANLPPDAWLFDVEKAPLFATVTRRRQSHEFRSNRRIALVDAVAGDVVGWSEWSES